MLDGKLVFSTTKSVRSANLVIAARFHQVNVAQFASGGFLMNSLSVVGIVCLGRRGTEVREIALAPVAPEQVDVHMVQQGCELQLPILLCCFAHTLQPAWPAFPTRRPAQVRLPRVLLGQRPSLRGTLWVLRWRLLAFVRLLRRYYAAVRLPAAVHEGLMAHRLLPPARPLPAGGNGVSRFSRMKFLRMLGVFDSAGPRRTRVGVRRVVAFRAA